MNRQVVVAVLSTLSWPALLLRWLRPPAWLRQLGAGALRRGLEVQPVLLGDLMLRQEGQCIACGAKAQHVGLEIDGTLWHRSRWKLYVDEWLRKSTAQQYLSGLPFHPREGQEEGQEEEAGCKLSPLLRAWWRRRLSRPKRNSMPSWSSTVMDTGKKASPAFI